MQGSVGSKGLVDSRAMVDSRAVAWVWEACREAACREADKWVSITNIMAACRVEACRVEACRYVPVLLYVPDGSNALHVLASCSCTMPCSCLASDMSSVECLCWLHALYMTCM